MSLYQHALIPVFPYSVLCSKEKATELVGKLMENNSSFAITMDNPVTLWMSETSWRCVVQNINIPEDLD